jgi:hypothetical protein
MQRSDSDTDSRQLPPWAGFRLSPSLGDPFPHKLSRNLGNWIS